MAINHPSDVVQHDTVFKACFKCGASKPLSNFYKHSKMKDGHVNKCKECNKKDVAENRQSKHAYYIQYDRNRGRDHESGRYKETCIRNKLPEIVKKRGLINKKNKLLYPLKSKARHCVSNSIRDGKLERPANCEYCGVSCKPRAHHSSYDEDMFLAVTWLCTKCHGEVHRKPDVLV